jgi:hypothetical protein
MVLGWAWACAMMAAGLSVRNQALLAEQQQQAQASCVFLSLAVSHRISFTEWMAQRLVPGVPTALQLQRFIFRGMFLDPRSVIRLSQSYKPQSIRLIVFILVERPEYMPPSFSSEHSHSVLSGRMPLTLYS